MSHLLRIILIHSHIDGVVELDLQGHSNICGGNAAGKTTLQRLIPVFYGENPNKVVPKTRKKFDQFYLPHSNSYLVYEYQRENGLICLAVLTRKSDEGVEYRFIQSNYQPELFLQETEQGVQALSYSDWASHLRQLKVDISPKLDTISHYRGVIQNDLQGLTTSRKENGSLRQLALKYSLADKNHRLRHIEKLVSAVHAKEGKMDTLKTMLAAIFEEEGISLPVTQIKSQQVREWVQKVQHSQRLGSLQQQFESLDEQAKKLAYSEEVLAQLYPQLINDEATLKTAIADDEAEHQLLRKQIKDKEEQYEQQHRSKSDEVSETESGLNSTQSRLSQIEKQYQHYLDQDMPALEQALEQLPYWYEECKQLEQRQQVFDDAINEAKQAFDQKLLSLSEQLRETLKGLNDKIDQTRLEEQKQKALQDEQREHEESQHRKQIEQEKEQFNQQKEALKVEQTRIEERLKNDLLNDAEKEEMAISLAHIEDLQEQADVQQEMVNRLQKDYEKSKAEREQQLKELEAQRRDCAQAEKNYWQLKQQAEPKEGSLRAFLQQNVESWRQTIGKTIHESLLERSDLSPQYLPEQQGQFFNVQLDLSAIAVPSFAQDDSQLKQALEEANQQLNEQKDWVQQLEEKQKQSNEKAHKAQQNLTDGKQKHEALKNDLQLAKQNRDALKEKHRQLNAQRKEQLQKDKQAIEHQQSQLKQQHQEQITQLEQSFKAFMLNKKASWQEEIQAYENKIERFKQEIKDHQQNYSAQEKEIEQLKNQELIKKGLDPKQLEAIKSQLQQRRQTIKNTEARREEHKAYQAFISDDWQQQKPKLENDEHQLKQQLQQLKRQREQLKEAFEQSRKQDKKTSEAIVNTIKENKQLLERIEPVVKNIGALGLRIQHGNTIEESPLQRDLRLAKAQQFLQQQNQLSLDLRSAMQHFENELNKDSEASVSQALAPFNGEKNTQEKLKAFEAILKILEDRQQGLIAQGRNFGKDLSNFFTVFRDLNNRIQTQSRRLSDEVSDDLNLEGVNKSEIKIQSTIDELSFWGALKQFVKLHESWDSQANELPKEAYLESLLEEADLLRSEQQFSFESLLRIELLLNEGGSDLVIRSDRQLLESSSHGMAYLILCKYLLAFTRLLRGNAQVIIHWPIDEIGTLAYHNVEKLFRACEKNQIYIVGAFPNLESEALTLFKQRYLIERNANGTQLKRVEPKLSRLSQKIQALREQTA